MPVSIVERLDRPDRERRLCPICGLTQIGCTSGAKFAKPKLWCRRWAEPHAGFCVVIDGRAVSYSCNRPALRLFLEVRRDLAIATVVPAMSAFSTAPTKGQNARVPPGVSASRGR